jgi:hypothetical protein
MGGSSIIKFSFSKSSKTVFSTTIWSDSAVNDVGRVVAAVDADAKLKTREAVELVLLLMISLASNSIIMI